MDGVGPGWTLLFCSSSFCPLMFVLACLLLFRASYSSSTFLLMTRFRFSPLFYDDGCLMSRTHAPLPL